MSDTTDSTRAGARLAEAVRAFIDARTLTEEARLAQGLYSALSEYDAATKPRTITATVEFPEPVREPLSKGERYYIADLRYAAPFSEAEWSDDKCDMWWLARGLIHRTREAAESHARALLAASEVKP